jgi:protein TonB
MRVNREFFLQQVYDSGVIGVAVLFCALLGLIVALRQLRRRAPPGTALQPRRARRQTLKIIASAAMLLGLLGTVVGLIHTFRALAHFGGADASIAAAGISHALSTTWMGLSVAIPLMLIQAALNGLPLRAGASGAIELPRRAANSRRQRRSWPRLAPALLGATVLTAILFFFMQWLTLRPLAEPVAPAPPLRVSRIDWDPPPPPPPEQPPVSLTAPPTASGSQPRELPAMSALPAPSTNIALPQFAFDAELAGLSAGSGALSGAGQMWTGATGGDGFRGGSDLVPISSARPRYPRAALDAAVEGWVEAIFIINADGSVSDVRIIDADPPGVFEQAAATALARWLYAPFYRDGKPVAREATQLLRFSLDDARDTYLRDEN